MVKEQLDIVVPDGWDVDVVDNVLHIGTGSKNTDDAVENALYPFFIRSAAVQRIDSYAYDEEAVLTAGDGQIGKIFHYINGKFNAHQRVYVLDHFSDRLDGKFFYYFFSARFYDEVMKQSAKTTVDSVRRNMIADMPILLPPLQEQKHIVSVLTNLDDLIEKQAKIIEKKKRFRDGMRWELITGHTRNHLFQGEWDNRTLQDVVLFSPDTISFANTPASYEFDYLLSSPGNGGWLARQQFSTSI